jgi:hypothetical protein
MVEHGPIRFGSYWCCSGGRLRGERADGPLPQQHNVAERSGQLPLSIKRKDGYHVPPPHRPRLPTTPPGCNRNNSTPVLPATTTWGGYCAASAEQRTDLDKAHQRCLRHASNVCPRDIMRGWLNENEPFLEVAVGPIPNSQNKNRGGFSSSVVDLTRSGIAPHRVCRVLRRFGLDPTSSLLIRRAFPSGTSWHGLRSDPLQC